MKVISGDSVRFLRRVPTSYQQIFEPFSAYPGAILYESYQSFEQKAPLPDEDIRSQKDKLEQGVLDCIQAACFTSDTNLQISLLKAAEYGKVFLPSDFDHDVLHRKCKELRVLSSINTRLEGRMLSHQQMLNLGLERCVDILLQYRKHLLAYEICKFSGLALGKRGQIFLHWASCKMEQSQNGASA